MQILNRLYQVDQRLFMWLVTILNHRTINKLARAFSRSGDGYLQVFIPLLMVFMYGSQGRSFFAVVAAAFAAERVIYWLLKNSLKRRRPPFVIPAFKASITASDEFSFPSGHTSAAFLLTALSFFYFPTLAFILLPWACLVGLSRVALGVHFPADILAGATLGTSVACYFHYYLFI